MSRMRSIVAGLAALAVFYPADVAAQRKKRDPNEFPQVIRKKDKKEDKEMTQVLPALKEPPGAVVAEASRLSWAVTPLSSKGLLSQQTRDALKWLFGNTRGGSVVKIRAFVAGTGDVRRVPEIVSEVFDDRRQPLPALSVTQVGGLPLDGAQVVLEATVVERKAVNEHGLAFFSGQRGTATDTAGSLLTAVRGANLDGEDVKRVTCYVSSLEGVDAMRQQVAQAFPSAVMNFVQLLRGSVERFVECEGAAALKRPAPKPVYAVGERADGFSVAVLVGPGRLVLTGTQLGFQTQDADLRLAFERLGKTLDGIGTGHKKVIWMNVYTLVRSTAERVGKMRTDFQGAEARPAGTALVFEGLPGLDASFGMDVIAAL